MCGRSKGSTGARIASASWRRHAPAGGHSVGCIVLGRGADDRKVREWLEVAAAVPGFIGFAVGRTVFWDPLVAWRSKQATRDQTVAEIARRYRGFVDVFEQKDSSLSSVAVVERPTRTIVPPWTGA